MKTMPQMFFLLEDVIEETFWTFLNWQRGIHLCWKEKTFLEILKKMFKISKNEKGTFFIFLLGEQPLSYDTFSRISHI